MRSQSLEEFAEDMRRKGDIRDADLADEILALLDLEEEVAEPYSNLIADLEIYAPEGLHDKPERAMEWLGDRSKELDEIRELFSEEELSERGVADAIKERLDTLDAAEKILEEHGWPGTDFLDALENLAENTPTPLEYDL